MNVRTKAIFCRIIPAVAFCLYSIISSAQIFPQASTSYGIHPRRGVFDSSLFMPTGCGIPTDSTFLFLRDFANQQGQAMALFAPYYDSCGHHLYGWDPSLKVWHVIDSSSGGGSDSGFQVLYAPLAGGIPIAKYVDSGGHRYILYDTTGSHPGGISTSAGVRKITDSLNSVIGALLSAKFGLSDTGYNHILASVYLLQKVNDSMKAVNAGLYNITAPNTANKYWNGYKQFVILNTDSLTEGATNKFFHGSDTTNLSTQIATKVTNSGGAKILGSGNTASMPAASAGPGLYYNTDSGFLQYSNGTAWSSISISIFARQGTSWSMDTLVFGGIAGAFTHGDTLYINGQPFLWYGLAGQATPGGTDSVLIKTAGQQLKAIPASSIAGSGYGIDSVARDSISALKSRHKYFYNDRTDPNSDSLTYAPNDSSHYTKGVLDSLDATSVAAGNTITTTDDGHTVKNVFHIPASGGGTPGNPTAKVGLTPVNGTAPTYMRSDAAPAWDTTIAPSFWRLYKTAAAQDTLEQLVYGIPQPTGSGVNGTQINWTYLTSGGGHNQSPLLDSFIRVSSGHLLCGYPTAQAVAFGTIVGDEVTYPIKWSTIGNFDNYEILGWVSSSGVGWWGKGNNTNSWQTTTNGLSPYSLTWDTVCATCPMIASFTLTDGSGMYLGNQNANTTLTYNGTNGYMSYKVPGTTQAFKYYFMDAAGDTVKGYPQASDQIQITNSSTFWNAIDFRQYLTANNYLYGGLPNGWFLGIIKEYPDSAQISRPYNSQAVATSTAGQINVMWAPISNAIAYQVDRSTSPNFSSFTTIVSTNITSYSDTGLTTGTTYYYAIRAIRSGNTTAGQYSGWVRRSAVAP